MEPSDESLKESLESVGLFVGFVVGFFVGIIVVFAVGSVVGDSVGDSVGPSSSQTDKIISFFCNKNSSNPASGKTDILRHTSQIIFIQPTFRKIYNGDTR